jgi:hypothetical protein
LRSTSAWRNCGGCFWIPRKYLQAVERRVERVERLLDDLRLLRLLLGRLRRHVIEDSSF